MTNFEAIERFDQAHGAKIEILFWIAGSIDSIDLKYFIEDLEDEDWQKLFPEIYKSESFQEYRDYGEALQVLVDFRKFGLIAEIHIPECYNFQYKDDKPVSWSVDGGSCRIEYVYAETLEELVSEVEKASEQVFQEYVAKDRKANNLAV